MGKIPVYTQCKERAASNVSLGHWRYGGARPDVFRRNAHGLNTASSETIAAVFLDAYRYKKRQVTISIIQ